MSTAFVLFLVAIAARTAIVLFGLIIGLRLLGKRQAGQMNLCDLVLITCLANSVQNAMTAGKGHLSVGLVSAGTLLLLGRLLTRLFVRHPTLEKRIIGTPTILVDNGQIVRDHLHREHITEEQLMAALREHGLCDHTEAKLAVLEVDGSLSIVPKGAPSRRTRRHFRALRLP